ncbi:MAG: acetyltransferase [Ruthenibacterium sp.]
MKTVENLLILGAGGYGRTVFELAQSLGLFSQIAFLDDKETDAEDVMAHCGAYRRPSLTEGFAYAYPAFGDNALRFAWLGELDDAGYKVPTLVHPSAYVSPSATLGQGVVVLPHAVINTGTEIGAGSIINIGALVDHDCVIGVCCHLAPGAIVKAGNVLPTQTKVDAGVVLARK